MEPVMEENYQLYHGDCLEVMDKLIEQGVKVDCVICDPPYGTTACKWDSVIPFEGMWKRLNQLIKPNGAIVLFGSEPFSSQLRVSNLKNYKYDWVWEKNRPTGLFLCKKQPMRNVENIIVFYKKQSTYNPQMWVGKKNNKRGNINGYSSHYPSQTEFSESSDSNLKYPRQILRYDRPHPPIHPTQKPVSLLEYLIKTYTNEGEVVLDFTMGSGSTGVAALNTNRKFIGIELDDNYFDIAKNRIAETQIHRTSEENRE